jgi:lysophospholipase L1-like esterase
MKVIGFGDSILKGVVLTDGPSMKYSLLQAGFLEQVCAAKGLELANHARFGSTISAGRSIFDRFVRTIGKGDIVLFEFGGNDCDFPWAEIGKDAAYPWEPLTPIKRFQSEYADMILRCWEKGARPLMLSLPPLVPSRFYHHVTRGLDPTGKENVLKWMAQSTDCVGNWHEQYNLAVFSLGQVLGVPVVDITTPFLLRPDYFNFICRDGIHPNERGHAIMAEWLLGNNRQHQLPASICCTPDSPLR